MLYVKIMSGEKIPDTSPYKGYKVVTVQNDQNIQFYTNPDIERLGALPEGAPSIAHFLMSVTKSDGSEENYELFGNAYVMTESGKTIASHGC